MGELRIGARVRTPRGVGEVTGRARDAELRPAWRVRDADGREGWWDASNLLPADIPRERVEALLEWVTARIALEAPHVKERALSRARHIELIGFASRLREMLEATDGE